MSSHREESYPLRYAIEKRIDPPEQPDIEIEREINAVEDLGISNDGTESVVDAVENLEDGEKLVFPPGEYLWDGMAVITSDNIGIEGLGDSHRDVKFVIPQGFADFFLNKSGGTGLLLKNFSLDQGNDKRTGVTLRAIMDDNFYFKDIEWLGFNPPQIYGTGGMIRARIETVDGLGVVDGLRVSGGGTIGAYDDDTWGGRAGGHRTGSDHTGTVYLINSDIRNLGSAAIYYTQHRGCARINNCFFKNNDNVNVRIDGGDHPSKRSWVKNTKVVVDTENATGVHFPETDPAYGGEYGGYINTRAILHESGSGGDRGYGGNGNVLVEDCEVIWKSAPPLSGRDGVVAVRGNHGSAEDRNLKVQVDSDHPLHDLFMAQDTQAGGTVRSGVPTDIKMENCHFSGSNENEIALEVQNRDIEISNSCVNFPNIDTGLKVTQGHDATVRNTSITVAGSQFDVSGSLSESNISSGQTCQLPSPEETVSGTPSTGGSEGTDGTSENVGTINVRQGEVEKLDDDPKSAVFGNTATGVLEQDSDRYRITGRISEFHVEEPVTVRVDGELMSGQEFIQRFVRCVPKAVSGGGQETYQESDSTNDDSTGGQEPGCVSIPAPDQENFESKLREVVGAKEGRSWQEFVDTANRNVHNVVEDHGAAMDSSTDDRQALQSAIDSAGSEDPSGIVLIPEGELWFSNRINITSDHNGVAIVGEGRSSVLRRGLDPGNDDYAGINFEAPYSTPKTASEFSERPVEFRDITLANFKLDGNVQGRGNPGWAIWQDMSKGRNIKVQNIWAENFNAGTLYKISGQTIENITSRNNNGHGIVFDNGVTQEDIDPRNVDPEPMEISAIWAENNGRDVGGRYGIDVSDGRHIHINGFITENNARGMKIPTVADGRIYNGLAKNNDKHGFQLNSTGDDYPVYFDNLRSEGNEEHGMRFANGIINIGTIALAENNMDNMYMSGNNTASITAERIVSTGAGRDGLVFNGGPHKVKNIESQDNNDSDIVSRGDLTVENMDAGSVDGNVSEGTVQSPELPGSSSEVC